MLIQEKVDTDERTHAGHKRTKIPGRVSLKKPITKIHADINHFAAKHGQIEEETSNLRVDLSHSTGYIRGVELLDILSQQKGSSNSVLYSLVTNTRECLIKKLYVSWIVEKVDIDERSHASYKRTNTPGNWIFKVTKY
jgi:hypothetical protein